MLPAPPREIVGSKGQDYMEYRLWLTDYQSPLPVSFQQDLNPMPRIGCHGSLAVAEWFIGFRLFLLGSWDLVFTLSLESRAGRVPSPAVNPPK